MQRWIPIACVALVLLFGVAPSVAQQKKKASKVRTRQYKRTHQDALKLIEAGQHDAAADFLKRFLEQHPDDEETLYMLAIATCQRGDATQARAYADQALAKGLPVGRLIAGPRDLLAPLHATPAFKRDVLDAPANAIVHGPMLGDVTGTTARVWVRTAREATVWAEVGYQRGDKGLVAQSEPVQTSADSDYTAVIRLTELDPATQLQYRVRVGRVTKTGRQSIAESAWHRFKTPPVSGKPAHFTLAFGGGAGYVPQHERVWDTISSFRPDALLLLGDNVYIDLPQSLAMQQYCYYRRQSRPEFARLVAKTPVYAIWDDHDFATNDSWGGPAIDEPAWKPTVWKVFQQNWPNPTYASGDRPGCWYTFSIGDVEFIMLDCRYYRTHPRGETLTMLGPQQLRWLKETLRRSNGTFKVVCSSVPWVFKAKGDSRDTWNGYQAERNDIFRFMSDHKIEGVVLMSADRHRSDLWKIERPDGYPFYEFNSSRLTNQHVHGEMKQAVFSYNKKQSFGLVEFDTTATDPTVTYTIVTIDGEKVFSHALRRSQLR